MIKMVNMHCDQNQAIACNNLMSQILAMLSSPPVYIHFPSS